MESVCTVARSRAKSSKTGLLHRFSTLSLVLFTLMAFSVASPLKTQASQATLSWDADTSAGVTGYKLYYGTASGTYSQSIDVGNITSYNVSNLTAGQTYYFAAVAYDASGNQSIYSNEVSKTLASTSQYTLTASAGTGGAISPSGSVAVTSGAGTTFTITPNTGYSIAGVKVDGVSVGAVSTYTFSNVTANHTIAATFSANPVSTYTLTASAGTGGSISPSGTATVSSGGSKAYTITASSGYKIADVKVDGVSVGAVSTYAFSNVTANHTIAASFTTTTTTAASYTINATVGTSGGSISSYGSTTIKAGASKTYTIVVYSGHSVNYVLVDGVSVGAVSTYTFSNVTANHTIKAYFK